MPRNDLGFSYWNGSIYDVVVHMDAGTGNVGLGGITNPSYTLDVGPNGQTVIAKFGDTSPLFLAANWPSIGFNAYWDGGNWKHHTGNAYSHIFTSDPTTGRLGFLSSLVSNTAGSNISLTQAMTITRDGKVGIGPNSIAPSGTLHVAGTVYLTRYGSAPTTCNGSVMGLLALTSAAKMCVCDGTSWKDVGSNYGACSW